MKPLWALPATAFRWAEGIAYSHDGALLAVAEYNGNAIALVSSEGIVGHIEGPRLCAPHDVAFSKGDHFLVVANRDNATVTVHERTGPRAYADAPSVILSRADWIGPTALSFEPSGDGLVVVDHNHSVTCLTMAGSVVWTLSGPDCGFSMPDGLTFSHDGEILAVANNLSHEVTLHEKAGSGYRSLPFARLGGLRHPHSLVFTLGDGMLIVTNSGGPDITVFDRARDWQAVMKWPVCEYETFLEAHYAAYEESGRKQACEGGAKGLALHGNQLAWSGPNIGLRVHELSFEEPA